MALVASPPPLPSNPPSDSLGDDILDDEISKVRAESKPTVQIHFWLPIY